MRASDKVMKVLLQALFVLPQFLFIAAGFAGLVVVLRSFGGIGDFEIHNGSIAIGLALLGFGLHRLAYGRFHQPIRDELKRLEALEREGR